MNNCLAVHAVLLVLVHLAYAEAEAPPHPARQNVLLPQKHEYQKQLRTWMATLAAKDFEHGVTALFNEAPIDDEERYRLHQLSFTTEPLFGTKRGPPSVNVPARRFLLSETEGADAIMKPHVWPEPLVWLVRWKYPGNPYHGSRALKLRAFVTMCVELLMVDDYQEKMPDSEANRTVGFAPHLIQFANPYPGVKDVLPPEVQQAYETGLRKMGQRVLDWGKGHESNLDMKAAIGLWYASQALGDPEFAGEVETYARRLFAYERNMRQANFYAIWLALATDWPFARAAVERTCRLRAHLCLPEPDGHCFGPHYFNTRSSSDAFLDSWAGQGYLDSAAAMITDEAAFRARLPDADEWKAIVSKRIQHFRYQVKENPLVVEKPTVPPSPRKDWSNMKNDEILSYPWQWRATQSYNFPETINFSYEHYRRGTYAHLAEMENSGSRFLKSPFLRDESFVRTLDEVFTAARMPGYAAIMHPAAGNAEELAGLLKSAGPYGLGAGQLSAFWTPATGSVLLGGRGRLLDDRDWRNWPMNAVSGSTADGQFFTSARVQKPDVVSEINQGNGKIRVSGTLSQDHVLRGKIDYTRTFQIDNQLLRIEVAVKSEGTAKVAELYEVLPVFLRETNLQKKMQPTQIELKVADKWLPATPDFQEKVTAVKLTRFTAAVQITLDQPRRVKLSPSDWTDKSVTRAACRNVLIDLLANRGDPTPLPSISLRYEIAPSRD